MNSNYYSAFKISLIFLVISSLYIFFSDKIVLQFLGDSASVEVLNTIQSYKGIGFVFFISVMLFFLIYREIASRMKYIKELEEKEKVSEELAGRNKYIQTILNNIPLGVAVNKFDEGSAIYINKQFEKIYGWPQEELIDITEFFQKVYPNKEYREKIQQKIISDIESGDPAKMRWENIEITTQNGEKKIIIAQNIPLEEQNLMISTVQDVTEMISVQRELERSKEQLKNITDNLPGAVIQYKLNPDGTDALTYVSEGAYSIWGISAEEAQKENQKIWNQIDKRDIEEVKKSIEISYKNLTPWSVEYRNKLPDGTVKWIEGTGLPFKQHDGSVIWDSIMLDITSRKEAEQEVKEAKTLLEKTINSLNEVVLVVDPEERKITLANSAIEKIFGYKPSEIIGKNTEILHLNHAKFDEFGKKSEAILENKGVFYTEFQMKHKNGSVIETENTVSGIKEKNGWSSGVVSVIRDVTNRKKTEERLHEYQESLKQLTTELSIVEEKQRKEFAANIHDHLSQLLVISQMKINDLKRQIQKEGQEKELEAISKHIAEALENSRKITYDLSPPVLYELGLVETMYWFTDKLNEEQNIRAKFTTNVKTLELPESKLIIVFRVIQELVNNVLKHAQANNLEIGFKAKKNSFEIKVADNGKGFRINGSLDTKFKKSGFGLFAVKERVNNLGGWFSVQSEPGIGTFIKITLPLNNKTEL